MNSGYVSYEQGDMDNAIYFFETAHKTLPADTAALLNLMHVYLDLKNYDKTKEYARKLLDNHYHKPAIYTLISSIDIQKGDWEGALNAVNEGLLKNARDKALLHFKANLLLDAEREIEAIAVMNELIAATNETHYYSEIGILYENLQMPDSAMAAYEKCLKHHPGNKEALHGLGFLNFTSGEKKKEEAYALPYEQTEQFKALIKAAKENYSAAKSYLDNALIVAPDDTSVKELSLRVERRLMEF